MRIIVDSQKELVDLSRFLVTLCNDVRLWIGGDDIKQRTIENILLIMRDSIEVKGGKGA